MADKESEIIIQQTNSKYPERNREPWQISSLKAIKLVLRGKTSKNLKMISLRLKEKASGY